MALGLAAVLLSACASSFKHTPGSDDATLIITGNTTNFFSEAYENSNCLPHADGQRLATFFGLTKDAEPHYSGKTITIPAGKPFVLTHHHVDSRFAENRRCSVTVSFLPERGKRYRSHFYVDANANRCDASVATAGAGGQLATNVASFKYPENLCLDGENKGPRNRVAVWTEWRVNGQR